ncbi:MAG: SDR family oxidoreductase [Actinobacteria bacterium]|nr:SDR family oxidoreductase [Actinomycetota bacterium]MTA78700.1 SDR family oxidoreductase [Actinomycetota bacterium]
MFDLTGKTALVTGAGQGVGFGIAATLLEAGAKVFVNDLVPERAVAAAEALGSNATALPFSVDDREAVVSAIAGIGPVDILVNNAGIPPTMRPVKFRDMDPAEWAAYIDVNLYGVINCVSATIDEMCERGWGRVITISSGAGTQGLNIGVSMYGAGKGGAISFMRHLAVETARSGVTANTLALGLMERDAPNVTEESRTVTASMAKQVPVGRLGTGRDIGYTCVFLASDEAEWITGQTIAVNGGSVTT